MPRTTRIVLAALNTVASVIPAVDLNPVVMLRDDHETRILKHCCNKDASHGYSCNTIDNDGRSADLRRCDCHCATRLRSRLDGPFCVWAVSLAKVLQPSRTGLQLATAHLNGSVEFRAPRVAVCRGLGKFMEQHEGPRLYTCGNQDIESLPCTFWKWMCRCNRLHPPVPNRLGHDAIVALAYNPQWKPCLENRGAGAPRHDRIPVPTISYPACLIVRARVARERMPVLEITFLGPPAVRCAGQDLSVAARKSAALLYYLAAQPSRAYTRNQLVALLWEESDEAAGRNSLSTALSRLRSIFPFPIRATGDSLYWDPSPEMYTDLAMFERLTAADQPMADPAQLDAAIALYRGAFLDGFEIRDSVGFEDWLRQERGHWLQRALAVSRQLLAHYQQRGQTAAAILVAQRALAIDPLQEPVYRTLMQLYAQAGDRASALAQYLSCERLLREGLDVEPSLETRSLRDAIASGRLLPPSAGPVRPPSRHVGAGSVSQRPRYPLVGRETELQRVWQMLEAPAAQRSRLLIVQGEAGIGKTRLIEEVLSQLQDAERQARSPCPGRPWTVLFGHSHQDAQGLPYHPLLDALRSQPALLDVEVLGLSDIWLAEINRLLPELAAQQHSLPVSAPLDPHQERRRLFEGIAQLLAALPPPRLVVLEDLHWADRETLHVLAYLVRHDRLADTLFLATVRSEEPTDDLEQILNRLEYDGWLQRLVLYPLSATTTASLVQAIVHDQATALAAQTYRETEGNPLFTVELVRSLLETGAWQPDHQVPNLGRLRMPSTVQAVIQSRLAQLDPAGRELLNSAAIFRRTFTFDEVQTVAGQSDEVALAALETLLRVHLLRETITPVAASVVATRYRFGHDQIRRVVYDSLSDARRQRLHRRLFDVLVPNGEQRAEELAHHATRSQSWSLALEWSERAAADALGLSAYASAVHLYEQALACAAQLPWTREVQQRVLDVRIRLARTAFYIQPGRLVEWLELAEAEASQLQDATRLTQVRLAQASALYILGQFTTALPRLDQLRAMAESTDDRLLGAQTDNILGRLLVIRGELRRGQAALERALAAAEPASGPIWSPTPLERSASLGLAACADAFRGQFAAASAWLDRCRQLESAPADAAMRAAEAFYRALVAHTRGDWTATVASATEAITRARAADNRIYEYVAHVYLGPALARQGQIAEGLKVQRIALSLADQAHTQVIVARAHAYLAEILLLAGQHEAAHAAADHGLTLAEAHGHLLEAALCARVRGEVDTVLGRWDAAAEALEDAGRRLAELEAWPERARAEAALGRLKLARGDSGQAHAHLTRAAQHFQEMAMAWDLAQARAVLDAS